MPHHHQERLKVHQKKQEKEEVNQAEPIDSILNTANSERKRQEHTSRYLEDTNIGDSYQGEEGRGPGAREQGRGEGLGKMGLGMAVGLGAKTQDLEAGQGDIEDGGAGLIDVVEEEGAGLIVIMEDEGAGLIVMVEDNGAGLIDMVEDETAGLDDMVEHMGAEEGDKE